MLASAVEYYSRQQRLTLAGLIRAEKAKGHGAKEIAKIIAAFQVLAVREASKGLTNMLDEQRIDITPLAVPTPSGLVGTSSAGFPLDSLFVAPTSDAVFQMIVATQLQDVARSAMGLGITARPRLGYVRQISAGACSRCAVLAGRFYRYSDGFLRHPRCGCKNLPTSEGLASGAATSPDEYFRSLEPARQDAVFTKSGAQAIRDGADMSQVVNVYRRSAGMQFAQVSPIKVKNGIKYTTEGTTHLGVAGKAQLALRKNGPQQMRPMPESIYQVARSQEAALRLLKLYGYMR